MSLRHLQELGVAFGVEPRFLLLGQEAATIRRTITFETIAMLLAAKLRDNTEITPDQLGDVIGWDIIPVLDDPDALWDYNVEAIYKITQLIGVDWVSALPSVSTDRASTS